MKLKICLLGMLCLFLKVNALPKTDFPHLKIGDKLPDLTITNIVNYPSQSIRLSNYRGKVLILDFWASWCSSCLEHFPLADSIQHQFSGELKLLLVDTKSTLDTKAKAIKAIRRFDTQNHRFDVPSAIFDVTLDQLFEHTVLPHYVWIDKDGYVRATTSAEELTRENVSQFIKTGKIPKYMKKDFDHSRPLYTVEDLPMDRLQHYSILIKGKTDGNGGGGTRYINDTARGLILHDRDLLGMYQMVSHSKFPGIFDGRYILQTKRQFLLTYKLSPHDVKRLEWERNNFYSYEIIVTAKEFPHIYDYILEDLNRYTQFHASFEKRNLKCWVLTSDNNYDKVKAKGLPWASDLENRINPKIHDDRMSTLAAFINSHNANATVLDKTGYKEPIDLDFNGDITDMDNLAKQLKAYGINLYQSTEDVDMLVIRDKSN